MAYTDKELKEATQIAYFDCNKTFETFKAQGKQPPYTIREIRDANIEGVDTSKFKNLTDEMLDWKIVTYSDGNERTDGKANSGFYGCIIETSEKEAIVAFRGSQEMTVFDNALQDWVRADLGLLNSTQTEQQADVEQFIEQTKGELKKYDSIVSTGHSLGGNLADYFAICMAKIGLDYKITKCVSYDGPNFSNEFIKANEQYINKVSDKMIHYKWSLVSNCLVPLPGVKQVFVQIKDYDDAKDEVGECGRELYEIIVRHDTNSLKFDKNGMLLEGEQDFMSKFIENFTQKLDAMPSEIGDTLYSSIYEGLLISYFVKNHEFIDENMNLTDSGKLFLQEKTEMLERLKTDFSPLQIAITLKVLVILIEVVIFEEIVIPNLTEFVISLVDEIGQMYNMSKEACIETGYFIIDKWNGFRDSFQISINPGYQYASENTEIIVNTDTLRGYADRINNINTRVQNLEWSMKQLYWKVGFLDLWDLINADFLTGYSWRLNECKNYLYNCANNFENAENNINRTFQ